MPNNAKSNFTLVYQFDLLICLKQKLERYTNKSSERKLSSSPEPFIHLLPITPRNSESQCGKPYVRPLTTSLKLDLLAGARNK